MHISSEVTVITWGKPSVPMVIISNSTTLTLTLPDLPTAWHKSCADYVTYELDAPSKMSPGPRSVHMGFYGYLRVCNSFCLAKVGVSIFDIGDANWRDAYDNQRPPEKMVDEVLAEEGFTAGDA